MKTRLRYLLLFIFAATPLVEVGNIKQWPLIIAAAAFAVHGLVEAMTHDRERWLPRDAFSAVLLLACLEVAAMFLITSLTLILAPPVTGDGHPVMPIGQVFIGMVGGGALGIALTFLVLRAPWRDRRLERRLLDIIGTLLLIAAVAGGFRS